MLALARRGRGVWFTLILAPPLWFVGLRFVDGLLSFCVGIVALLACMWLIALLGAQSAPADYWRCTKWLVAGGGHGSRSLLEALDDEIRGEEDILTGRGRYFLYPSALIVVGSPPMKALRIVPVATVASTTFEIKNYWRMDDELRLFRLRQVCYEVALFDASGTFLACAICHEQAEAMALIDALRAHPQQ